MSQPFDVCWERIRRADAHRNALSHTWDAFLEGEPYDSNVDVENDGTVSIWIKQIKPIPNDLPLLLGELLYQLRAALDASIYEAACLIEKRRPPAGENTLEFPICDSPMKFAENAWKIRPLTDDHRSIIKSVQPYEVTPGLTPAELIYSFNYNIGILNDWARKDRHRKLHVVASYASNIRPAFDLPLGTSVTELIVLRSAFVFEDPCKIAILKISGWKPAMRVQANPNLTLDIGVDEIPPPCHDTDRLSHRLLAMVKAVSATVCGFAEIAGIRLPDDFLGCGVIRPVRQQ